MSEREQPQVGIIMGSDSDLPVMKQAAEVLESFGISAEVTVVSAHRTPERLWEYATQARSRDFKVIIAGAGGAAHLPGMVASMTELPVIGVPIQTKTMKGIDSLLSIAQMPPGIPVATMAVNGAKNAGLLAVRMLGLGDSAILDSMHDYQKSLEAEIKIKAEKLEAVGYEDYLKEKGE
ncbi:MAG TPA: 5-(carboxyamino)imidazole ribonucleotide mutase [Candidatus Saccharimonadia bacterium]